LRKKTIPTLHKGAIWLDMGKWALQSAFVLTRNPIGDRGIRPRRTSFLNSFNELSICLVIRFEQLVNATVGIKKWVNILHHEERRTAFTSGFVRMMIE
jgi:hypothetical protein